MAQQEDGWPLGLQPLNARVGLVRNHDRNGSISFSTLLTASSSTQSSSDLDTESTGSFFRDKSITLGTLMGVSSILELSRRSMRLRPPETLREKKSYKSKPWLFSLCSKLSTDAVSMSNTPSLGHFLEAERRAASVFRQNTVPPAPSGQGSMFVGERSNREMFEQGSGYGAPLLLSCLCRQLIE
ncbi:uncharacterized protein LOC130759495 [Actinidia eriantha]|uniref:uncharacterized protein LOC130759495 n=1 Tax=Actinidia eriantha TaxID=165200 RepID=UPI00258DF629|nr:uncharacterized protein LOC130759495 [Actinidia eriantha]XP_057470612.1 uncharacterized protein LOC130759495 [Actinidia eriantha]XP_057470613.1 uncharacterized protein LOC130759495 [Actinidia eriantha]